MNSHWVDPTGEDEGGRHDQLQGAPLNARAVQVGGEGDVGGPRALRRTPARRGGEGVCGQPTQNTLGSQSETGGARCVCVCVAAGYFDLGRND